MAFLSLAPMNREMRVRILPGVSAQKNSSLRIDSQLLFVWLPYPSIRLFSVSGSNRCMTFAGKVMYILLP